MSTPMGRQNLNGALHDNVREVGFALDSTGVVLSPGLTGVDLVADKPCSVYVFCKLSSGSGSLLMDTFVPGATHNFGSASMTLTLSGTGYVMGRFDLLSSALGYAFKLTTNANMIISDLEIITMNQLHAGQGWFDATSAQNGTASSYTGSDASNQAVNGAFTAGSGVLKLGPAQDNRFGT